MPCARSLWIPIVLALSACSERAPEPPPAPSPAPGPDPAPTSDPPTQPDDPADQVVAARTLAPSPAAAAAQRWMTYQYLSNDPERAPVMIGAFISAGWHEANPDANALGVLSAFLGQLALQSPDHLDAWAEAAPNLPADAQSLFAYAVWVGDPGNAEARVRRIVGAMPADDPRIGALLDLPARQPPDLAAVPLESAAALDLWWGAFMATGDTRWVDLVLTALPPPGLSREQSGFTDPLKIEIARAAVWSLASNAFQHPRVLEHLRARRKGEPNDWPEIDAVIANAERTLQARASPAPPPQPSGP